MTTIVAVQKQDKVVIGADSLTLYGSRKELSGQLVVQQDKIIRFRDVLFGVSGHASWSYILRNYLKSCSTANFSSLTSIFKTLHEMHSLLKERYYLTPCKAATELFESSEFHFLVVTKLGIFDVEWDRTITQYTKFAAIGSGEEYALGAMQATYFTTNDCAHIARMGIEAASFFDSKTQLPVQIVELN